MSASSQEIIVEVPSSMSPNNLRNRAEAAAKKPQKESTSPNAKQIAAQLVQPLQIHRRVSD
jgi:hypothetical protein